MEHMKKGRQDCPTEKGAWKQNDNATHIPSSHSHFLRVPQFLSWCVCVSSPWMQNDYEWLMTHYETVVILRKNHWAKDLLSSRLLTPKLWKSAAPQTRSRPKTSPTLPCKDTCLFEEKHTQVFLGVPRNSHTFPSSHLSLWSVQSAAPTGNPVCTSLPIAVASNSSDLKATRAQEQTCREKNGPLTAEALTCSTKFGSRPGKESKARYSFASY